MPYGSTQIVIKGYEDVQKELKGLEKKAEKVVNRTIGDFKTRGPGWVSQEVMEEYTIKKKEINSTLAGKKSAGTIKVHGTKLDNIQLIYQGRMLTPTHFQMKPASRPSGSQPYTVTHFVKKKEGRKALSHKAFLAESGSEGTIQIPFQRSGDARYPIEPIKTVSVPQMITNEKVSKEIQERINTELGKRLKHNMNTIMKKR
ncbi:MAG: phage tail protein [bacterium]|nr:phage tail protein [bacterium]